MAKIKNRQLVSKKFLLFLAAAGILIILGLLIYNNQIGPINQDTAQPAAGTINLSPPTAQDLEEAEQHKQKLAANKQAAAAPAENETRLTVSPIFGFLNQAENGNIEANGYITGVIENGGVCTLTLEKNEQSTSTSNPALADAQSTVCGLMIIERSQLNVGDWTATITYSSPQYYGISEKKTIRVN